MAKGASKGGGGGGKPVAVQEPKKSEQLAQFDPEKAGKTYQSLPAMFRFNIRENLKLSQAMKDNIDSAKPVSMQDEWTTKLKSATEKRKVITEYKNGKLKYTVKSGNKVLLKEGTAEQAANQIAMYYASVLRKMG